MTDKSLLIPEDDENARRDTDRAEERKDPGVAETLSGPFTSIIRPLGDQEPDPEDIASQREENDAESRSG